MDLSSVIEPLIRLREKGTSFCEESSDGEQIELCGTRFSSNGITLLNYVARKLPEKTVIAAYQEVYDGDELCFEAHAQNGWTTDFIQAGRWFSALMKEAPNNKKTISARQAARKKARHEFLYIFDRAEKLALAGRHFAEQENGKTLIGRVYESELFSILLTRTEKGARNSCQIQIAYEGEPVYDAFFENKSFLITLSDPALLWVADLCKESEELYKRK